MFVFYSMNKEMTDNFINSREFIKYWSEKEAECLRYFYRKHFDVIPNHKKRPDTE